ncbi:MAG TPA: hypothetical protein GXZ82_02130 [Firmicutes bacterium]|jgi:hypothetical protein|nr:hypothetical protein [Bacillota bacterium]
MQHLCEICGKAIQPGRIKALPGTKRCIDCARKQGSDYVIRRIATGMDIDTYKDLLGATRS